MGAGKTSVAVALSRRLGCSMADLDQFITEREGRSPQRIIDENGEAEFRQIETRALHQLLKQGAARVVALGGGTWTIEENRGLIKEHGGLTVWLDAPVQLCWRRIKDTVAERPLSRTRANFRRLFDARRALYETADLRVEVEEQQSADEIALEIMTTIEKR